MEDHYQVGELPNSFFNHNWDEDSIDQSLNFESALSSMVSSPVASNSSINPTDHSSSIGMRELIGRLGSICNSDEISHQKSQTLKTSSCYTTPLNSPPKLNLSIMDHSMTTHQPLAPFSSNPGFTERAARFSSFGTRSFNGLSTQFGSNEHEFPYRSSTRAETGNLSRVSSTQSLKNAGSQMRSLSISEFNNTHEDSSISEQIPVKENGLKGIKNDENARKRKTVQRGKAKETDSNSKRSKSSDDSGNEKDSVKNSKDNQKPSEPPKDYIHVRARRGEATDSHSLAERVRREKFSEKMKFLQDLIPGCNKITGKAVVLDEIINYVQSLQRQVEFLSMKLATFNPRLDSNMETLLSKDILQSRGPFPNSNYPLGSSASTFPYGQLPHQQGLNLQNGIANGVEKHCSMNPLDSAAFRRNLSLELPPFDGFLESASQLTSFWEDDLQSVVQMGFNQNQEHGLSSTHMKVEP